MDINNPIIQLCIKGSEAELQHDLSLAKEYYLKSLYASKNDYDYCISAHYLARVQENNNEVLKWNTKALFHADKIKIDDISYKDIKEFYPSLYLNMGESYKLLNETDNAVKYFKMGLDYVKKDIPGSYGDMIKQSFINKISELENSKSS